MAKVAYDRFYSGYAPFGGEAKVNQASLADEQMANQRALQERQLAVQSMLNLKKMAAAKQLRDEDNAWRLRKIESDERKYGAGLKHQSTETSARRLSEKDALLEARRYAEANWARRNPHEADPDRYYTDQAALLDKLNRAPDSEPDGTSPLSDMSQQQLPDVPQTDQVAGGIMGQPADASQMVDPQTRALNIARASGGGLMSSPDDTLTPGSTSIQDEDGGFRNHLLNLTKQRAERVGQPDQYEWVVAGDGRLTRRKVKDTQLEKILRLAQTQERILDLPTAKDRTRAKELKQRQLVTEDAAWKEESRQREIAPQVRKLEAAINVATQMGDRQKVAQAQAELFRLQNPGKGSAALAQQLEFGRRKLGKKEMQDVVDTQLDKKIRDVVGDPGVSAGWQWIKHGVTEVVAATWKGKKPEDAALVNRIRTEIADDIDNLVPDIENLLDQLYENGKDVSQVLAYLEKKLPRKRHGFIHQEISRAYQEMLQRFRKKYAQQRIPNTPENTMKAAMQEAAEARLRR